MKCIGTAWKITVYCDITAKVIKYTSIWHDENQIHVLKIQRKCIRNAKIMSGKYSEPAYKRYIIFSHLL